MIAPARELLLKLFCGTGAVCNPFEDVGLDEDADLRWAPAVPGRLDTGVAGCEFARVSPEKVLSGEADTGLCPTWGIMSGVGAEGRRCCEMLGTAEETAGNSIGNEARC